MLKSVILSHHREEATRDVSPRLHFIGFTDSLGDELTAMLTKWRLSLNASYTFEIRPPTYPQSTSTRDSSTPGNSLRNAFAPCASLRLFFPDLITDIDKLIYLDNDILLVNEISHLWKQFDYMNEDQIAGLALENKDD